MSGAAAPLLPAAAGSPGRVRGLRAERGRDEEVFSSARRLIAGATPRDLAGGDGQPTRARSAGRAGTSVGGGGGGGKDRDVCGGSGSVQKEEKLGRKKRGGVGRFALRARPSPSF